MPTVAGLPGDGQVKLQGMALTIDRIAWKIPFMVLEIESINF
jgi:hypothetical protein